MRLLLILCLLLAAVPGFTAEEPKPTPQLRLLVPAYFYPSDKGLEEWRRMAKAASDVPIVAIANPASGPGERRDPNYTSALKLARDAGVTVIGYVTTSYGKRPQKDVQAEVDRWFELYPTVNGIFFDEQPSGKDSVPYCTALAQAVHERRKEHGALVMSNPGTVCAPGYVTPWSGINLCCLQENKFGLERYQPPDWTRSVPPAQVVGLVYDEPSIARMRANVQEALKKRVGYVYITDRTGANPWDGLPGYWELEVAELRRINGKNSVPGMFTDVPQTHWAYDALQQLLQRGIIELGIPDGTYAGKRAFNRFQMGGFVHKLLSEMMRATLPDFGSRDLAQRDARAMEMLSTAFPEELAHFGVTQEYAAWVLKRLREKLKLPAR